MKSIIITLIALLILPTIFFAQEIIATTMGNTYGTTLYFYDNGSLKRVFALDNWICLDDYIHSSFDSKYVAAIFRTRELVKDRNGASYIDHKLFIFNRKGKLFKTLTNVINFSWSPDSRQIVYVEAKGNYESYNIIPKTLKVFDLYTSKIISFSSDGYADITWSNHDNIIYYTDFVNVYKVNPQNGDRVKVDYRGIHFSTYGKYYYKPNYEGEGFQLFETKSNRDITPSDIKKEDVNFYRWISNDELVVGDVTLEKKIIDVSTGKTKKTITGKMIGYDPKTSEIYIHKDKKVFKELSDSKIEKIKIEN